MRLGREFVGEALGTFILVLFGTGSVAVTTLFGAHQGLFQIGVVWGIGVALAIYVTRHLCCAHLNPAVSIAMVVSGRMRAGKLLTYLVAQFFGAFVAGLTIYLLFSSSIAAYEQANGILRGSPASMETAKMFGEYYNLPGGLGTVSTGLAMAVEAFGTFLLVLAIFSLTEGCNLGRPSSNIAPVLIGLTVTSIICLLAPLTQAGLNPARDLSPRLVALMFGWGGAAMPDAHGGFLLVYVLAPILGGLAAALGFTKVLEPLMMGNSPSDATECCDAPQPAMKGSP